MRYIAAYLLLLNGGNASPSSSDITKLLSTVGCVWTRPAMWNMELMIAFSIDTDEDRLSKLLSELEGKDVNTIISEGSAKLASVPFGRWRWSCGRFIWWCRRWRSRSR